MFKSSVLVMVPMMILCLVSTLIMSLQSQAGEAAMIGFSTKSQL